MLVGLQHGGCWSFLPRVLWGCCYSLAARFTEPSPRCSVPFHVAAQDTSWLPFIIEANDLGNMLR